MQILHPSTGGLYTGLTNAVSTIYRIEGLRTLWKGVTSVIVGAGMIQLAVTGQNRSENAECFASQGRLMPFTLAHTRLSRSFREAMWMMGTIL
jgi:hypothetical protein